MSGALQGVSSLDLAPGDYTIEPAEWRRDVGQQLTNITSGNASGDEGGEAMWHLHDVERDDTCVLEVFEDRREMDGALQTSGRQFLFRTPSGDPAMAYERDGHMVGTRTTLSDVATGEELARWEMSGLLNQFLRRSWELSDPDGTSQATARRQRLLGGLTNATFDLTAADGSELGQFTLELDGLFLGQELSLEQSPFPVEVLLAMGYGILWATSQQQQ